MYYGLSKVKIEGGPEAAHLYDTGPNECTLFALTYLYGSKNLIFVLTRKYLTEKSSQICKIVILIRRRTTLVHFGILRSVTFAF